MVTPLTDSSRPNQRGTRWIRSASASPSFIFWCQAAGPAARQNRYRGPNPDPRPAGPTTNPGSHEFRVAPETLPHHFCRTEPLGTHRVRSRLGAPVTDQHRRHYARELIALQGAAGFSIPNLQNRINDRRPNLIEDDTAVNCVTHCFTIQWSEQH